MALNKSGILGVGITCLILHFICRNADGFTLLLSLLILWGLKGISTVLHVACSIYFFMQHATKSIKCPRFLKPSLLNRLSYGLSAMLTQPCGQLLDQLLSLGKKQKVIFVRVNVAGDIDTGRGQNRQPIMNIRNGDTLICGSCND